MVFRIFKFALLMALLVFGSVQTGSALPPSTVASVVSVLPDLETRPTENTRRPGIAPEGSGIVLQNRIVATAWHVIESAERIDVRLPDGRVLPAQLLAKDVATDIAVLSVNADLTPFERASTPDLAEPVCAIGNAWGLGLSVTCGVVSAQNIADAGFNAVEHFVQTDAATNPGMSGGALVDAEGRLVGMLSAIFASGGDANIGVNFAVSGELLERVTSALINKGEVHFVDPGWRLAPPGRAQLMELAAPYVSVLDANGRAFSAGIRENDLITHIDNRRIRTPRDAVAALALVSEHAKSIKVVVLRNGEEIMFSVQLDSQDKAKSENPPESDCPHPQPVCSMRQAVFPISSFDPVGSATRIGQNLLVTNRHVVGDRRDAVVHTPLGPLDGRVVPSAYTGDLALIEVEGLPPNGIIASLEGQPDLTSRTFAIGADIARQSIRVFDPGSTIDTPASGAEFGRVHVTSYMQPGTSGGALVDETGELVGINVGGGEGRYEAIPIANVRALVNLTEVASAADVTQRLGSALANCAQVMENTEPRTAEPATLEGLAASCKSTNNHGQLLEAGRILAMAGAFEAAIDLHSEAVRQVPNSINARVSLLVSLQLAGRFEDMTRHARDVMQRAPDDPQVLRFAIQSGVWGGQPELAEEGYQALLKADPNQAQAARRFIDRAPPAPVRR